MTFVNICEQGHEHRYELYSKELFDRQQLRPEEIFVRWKCPECKSPRTSGRFIDVNPYNKGGN